MRVPEPPARIATPIFVGALLGDALVIAARLSIRLAKRRPVANARAASATNRDELRGDRDRDLLGRLRADIETDRCMQPCPARRPDLVVGDDALCLEALRKR